MMTKSYQVEFYRHLLNSYGHPYRSRLTSVRVADCSDESQAVVRAIERFKYEWSLWDWRALADEYVVREDLKH